MNYRIGTLDDIPEIIRLRIEFLKEVTLNYEESAEQLLARELENYLNEHLASGDFVNWIVIHNEAIIATGGICFNSFPPSYTALNEMRAYIMNVYTLPLYRGQGIGSKIFEKLIEEATRRGVSMISLHTTGGAKSLYEKFGFRLQDNEMSLILPVSLTK